MIVFVYLLYCMHYFTVFDAAASKIQLGSLQLISVRPAGKVDSTK